MVAAQAPELESFLEQVLPHDVILDEAHGVVLLSQPRPLRAHLALGCAWDVTPVNVEVADEAVCLDLARQHEALIRSLPIGAALQVLWTLRPTTQAPEWEAVRATLPAGQDCQPLLDAQLALIRAGMPHRDGPLLHHLRTAPTLVTFRLPLPKVAPGLGALVRTLSQSPTRTARDLTTLLQDHLGKHIEAFLGIANGLGMTLRAAGHRAERLTGTGIGRVLARALDPLSEETPTIQSDLPLRHQARTRRADADAGTWYFPDDEVPLAAQVLSLYQATPQTYPGILSSARAPDKTTPLALWNLWPGPLTIAVNIAATDPEVEKGRLQTRKTIATMQQNLNDENLQIKKALDGLLGRLFAQGGAITWGRIHLVAWGQPERLATESTTLIRAARRFLLEFTQEPRIGSTLFLQTLPLGFDPTFPEEKHLQRARRLELHTLADCLPLYGCFTGTATPDILYVNRYGATAGFSFFDSTTNRHFIIKGGSGAGKSFGAGHILNQVLPLGASACVLDHLPSYADLCATWGGHNLVMDYDAPICFNPFFGPLTHEHTSFITEIIGYMASGGRDSQILDQEHMGVLAKALGHFASLHRGGSEKTISDFYQSHLEDGGWTEDRRARSMARAIGRRLGKFIGDGPCAGFVDGRNTFSLHPILTVLELSKLRDEDLKGVVLLALMHLLSVFYANPRHWARRKYFLCDETWALIQYASIAELLVKVSLTYRKMGVSAGFISQHASHFQSATGRVLKDIAALKLFLFHEASELAETADVFQWTAAERALFTDGVVQKHADWSTAYLSFSDKSGGVVRLIADPMTRWQMSQEDSARALRADAMAKANGNPWQAMAQLVAEHPFLVRP